MSADSTYCAFSGDRLVARGELDQVLTAAKAELKRARDRTLLFFEEQTGKQIEFNLTGSIQEVLARNAAKAPARVGPGRPKLGVVSREVSLLPRHWEWLEHEPQGISATLRRLVDEAKKKHPGEQQGRLAREAVHRFITALAGHRPHYEEAIRALFARDDARFRQLIAHFPADIREEALRLLAAAP